MKGQAVKDLRVSSGMGIKELMEQMRHCGGFNARLLARGWEILREMVSDKECLRMFSFPACLMATGTRGVIRDFVKEGFFDLVLTTCGTLDHDLARSYAKYYHGSFHADDGELRRRGINRLGNVFVPHSSYGLLIEKKMQRFLEEIYRSGKRELSTYELCWELGRWIGKEDSFLYWCYRRRVPVIVPGITDGAVGYQLWSFCQDHRLRIDPMKDESLLSERIWSARRTGALVVGGGISKHHLLWWAQFGGGLHYAVYLTTAQEYDGSLSGARTHEAISWGKIGRGAKHVTVEGDATLCLPLLLGALKGR
ncbi:MAG: deoxyhypusine synthase [Hadesarchaea archaeon]|jgi:deoxyhypusine synthase|nr:MAG: deoxyhypusine synthase [Hadesarchaea archaeon]